MLMLMARPCRALGDRSSSSCRQDDRRGSSGSASPNAMATMAKFSDEPPLPPLPLRLPPKKKRKSRSLTPRTAGLAVAPPSLTPISTPHSPRSALTLSGGWTRWALLLDPGRSSVSFECVFGVVGKKGSFRCGIPMRIHVGVFGVVIGDKWPPQLPPLPPSRWFCLNCRRKELMLGDGHGLSHGRVCSRPHNPIQSPTCIYLRYLYVCTSMYVCHVHSLGPFSLRSLYLLPPCSSSLTSSLPFLHRSNHSPAPITMPPPIP